MAKLEHKWGQQRDHPFTCLGCGKQDLASRPDAKCCSPKCRQRYKRGLDQSARAKAIAPEIGGMQAPSRPQQSRRKNRALAAKSADRTAGKPSKAKAKAKARSTTRSTTSKKGAKKK